VDSLYVQFQGGPKWDDVRPLTVVTFSDGQFYFYSQFHGTMDNLKTVLQILFLKKKQKIPCGMPFVVSSCLLLWIDFVSLLILLLGNHSILAAQRIIGENPDSPWAKPQNVIAYWLPKNDKEHFFDALFL